MAKSGKLKLVFPSKKEKGENHYVGKNYLRASARVLFVYGKYYIDTTLSSSMVTHENVILRNRDARQG